MKCKKQDCYWNLDLFCYYDPSGCEYHEQMEPDDVVVRDMSGIETELVVTAVDDLIHCGDWTFHKETWYEVDDELEWDGVTRSGSVIRPGRVLQRR